MTFKSSASIETAKASSYLQQLCKHFGHKLDVEFSPEAGTISFDFGKAALSAENGVLLMSANADTEEDHARLERVLASHLERFAFREDLTINWIS